MSVLGIITRINDKDPEKRLQFRVLPRRMKTEIVGFLKCQGMLAEELAHNLRIPKSTVYYYWKLYTKELALFVRRNANQYIGRLAARAEHLYKAAKAAKQYRTCWKIEIDLFEKLVQLGLIETVPQHIDVTVRDKRDPEIIEAELAGDMKLLDWIRNGNGVPQLPAPGRNGGSAASDEGAGAVPEDAQ